MNNRKVRLAWVLALSLGVPSSVVGLQLPSEDELVTAAVEWLFAQGHLKKPIQFQEGSVRSQARGSTEPLSSSAIQRILRGLDARLVSKTDVVSCPSDSQLLRDCSMADGSLVSVDVLSNLRTGARVRVGWLKPGGRQGKTPVGGAATMLMIRTGSKWQITIVERDFG